MKTTLETVDSFRAYGGLQQVCRHRSETCRCDMTFAVYLPPQCETRKVPVLWYLSGLTCTHENAMTKGNFQSYAAQHGLALVFPDTSPRGESVPDDEAYDLGQGAGFYVNATQTPWKQHYQMYDYVVEELPAVLSANFPQLDVHRQGITGHSMGGHGALTIALNNQEKFDSLSAFAPIANPTASDWGRKQLQAYLGDDEAHWAGYDASILIAEKGWKSDLLIDQGTADNFLDLLRPQELMGALAERRQPATVRFQQDYDHSYFFIASFAQDHVRFHAQRLVQTDS